MFLLVHFSEKYILAFSSIAGIEKYHWFILLNQ